MEYNFWDDRTYHTDAYNPCEGCEDFQEGKCVSNGGCAEILFDKNSCENCEYLTCDGVCGRGECFK